MSEMRGRPLAWVAVTLSVWIGARVATVGPDDSLVAYTQPPSDPIGASSLPAAPEIGALNANLMSTKRRAAISSLISKPFAIHPALDPWQDRGRPSGLPVSVWVADGGKPLSTGRDTPPTNALAPVGKAGSHIDKRRWGSEVYAYSFWRLSSRDNATLAPGAQYGGSQSGLIATLDPFGEADRGLSVLARTAVTPDWRESEVALGLRWKPNANWPFTLSAERRFRDDGPDRIAAYLAGGVNSMPLAEGWNLDLYGQAGYASGRSGGGFFDAQARVTYPLIDVAGLPLSIGVGSWAGGQRGVARLDAGPTVMAKVDAGPAALLIQLDWRLQVAGNAEPRDGLALTVSTGF